MSRDGGRARDRSSDDQNSGGDYLREARVRAHPTEQTGRAGVAVFLAGIELSGCRTSDVGGNGATKDGKARG